MLSFLNSFVTLLLIKRLSFCLVSVVYYTQYSSYSLKRRHIPMQQGKGSKSNPIVSDLSLVESASRGYVVNDCGSLRSTERILRQDPRTARELNRTGGLAPLLTRSGNEDTERRYFSRFVNYQTSLFIDRLTQGDILRTPALETLFEQARENTNISINIGTELESCCGEIKSKLDNLSVELKAEFRRLRRLLIGSFSSIQTEASKNFELLTDTALESRALILNQLNERLNTLEVLINQINTFIQNKITERSDLLEDLLRTVCRTILTSLTEKSDYVVDKIKTLLTDLELYIRDSFEALLFNIESALTAQIGSLMTSLESFYTSQVLPLLSGIAAGVGELVGSTSYISSTVTQTLTLLKVLPKRFEELLESQVEDFKKYLDDWKKDLIKELAEEVSLQVVGESYYKWDSVTTYFPTITFLFKEEGVSQYARRSQIKLRLSKRNEDLTDLDIKSLKQGCTALLNASYCYGTQRFNYVSSDKRFKTTVFGTNSSQIKSLFKSLFKVINEPFEERNLSITSSRARINQTKRSSVLGGVGLNTFSYGTSFNVKFKKAVLLVNGLKRPIVLAES